MRDVDEQLPVGPVAAAVRRRCGRCRVVRPVEMFYVDLERRESVRRGRRITMPCRVCQLEKNDAWRADRQAMVDRIKLEAGCADCGIRSEHPEIYDFDHLPGELKVARISTLLTKGTIEDLLAEIAKCEVVCANCHRIRTRARAAAADVPGADT